MSEAAADADRPDRRRGRAGYAFEGPALELGGLMLDADHAVRRPHPDPAGDAQPARPGRRRDRHRQDQDPAAARRAAERPRRAGLRRRHQGRPVRAGDARARPARRSPRAPRRSARSGQATGFPVEFYALGGQGTGIPLRVTMSAFGPMLLSKVLGLNDTQESSLGLVFHYADKAGLPLLDLADLRAVVSYLTSDEGKADLKELGGLSSATAGVILRELIAFQDQGADAFFGEPEFESADLLQAGARRPGPDQPGRAAQPAGPAGGLLDVPDVAARRPLPRPARGRRHRQAQAGLLLRRGAPALRRRLRRRSSTRSPRRCG